MAETVPDSTPACGPGRPVCRHCRAKRVSRPRGLCWNCYYSPGVKELYPGTGRGSRHGPGNVYRNAPLAPEPTAHPPGTAEKLAVMAARAEGGFRLWHPDDAPHTGGA